MSENILIGKSRKTGKWEILVDPGETYDTHLRAYQKISRNLPVNDDYSKVLLGRVQNTSAPLTLITAEEKSARDEQLAATVQVASNAGKDAEGRQARIAAETESKAQAIKSKTIDEKNAIINRIRRATGQPAWDVTQTETDEDALRERLSKAVTPAPAPAKPAEPGKTKEELLAEKNALVNSTKAQAEELLAGQEKAQAEKSQRIESQKTPDKQN
jgi:hypothetical protein